MSSASTILRRINREVPVRLVVNRQAPVAPLAERLDADDMDRLRSVIWQISRRAKGHKAIAYGLWKQLRETTGVPAPHPFTVDHLPAIACELRRCWEIVNAVAEAHEAALKVMTRRLIAGLEEPGPILAVLDCEFRAAANAAASEIEGSISVWEEADLRDLLRRADDSIKAKGRNLDYDERAVQTAYEEAAQLPQPTTNDRSHS